MQQDSRGLPLTTANPEAAAHLERAIESFNYWKVDVMDHLGAALEAARSTLFRGLARHRGGPTRLLVLGDVRGQGAGGFVFNHSRRLRRCPVRLARILLIR